MSITIEKLVEFLDQKLNPRKFSDYTVNGLQVEGNPIINNIITGVTASEALINKAIENHADAILVHHGYFWKGETPCIIGIKQKRIKKLLTNNINLLAYHLPLDAHPEIGNNAKLANLLGISITGSLNPLEKLPIGNIGQLAEPTDIDKFIKHLEKKLLQTPIIIKSKKNIVQNIAWCTGAAQDSIEHAINQKADVYISGEISERTVHIARECNIHYIAAGHHATERYGIQALGELLQKTFNLNHLFIDIPNPV